MQDSHPRICSQDRVQLSVGICNFCKENDAFPMASSRGHYSTKPNNSLQRETPKKHSFSFALLIPAKWMAGITNSLSNNFRVTSLEFFVKFCQKPISHHFGFGISFFLPSPNQIPIFPETSKKGYLKHLDDRSSKSQNRSKKSVYHPPSNSHK